METTEASMSDDVCVPVSNKMSITPTFAGPNRPVGGHANIGKLPTCPSMDINMDQHPELMDYLPKDYQYHVCRYEEVSQPSPRDHHSFEATLRMTLATKEDLQVWLKSMPYMWRVDKVRPSKGKKTILKTEYRCQHNTKPRSVKSNRKTKNLNCSAKLKVTIVRPVSGQLSRSADPHIPAYPTIVELSHVHNHNIHDAAALRYRDVGTAAVEKLTRLFEAGHSPASALDFLKYELQVEYGDDYVDKSADRSICPDLKFCYSLYARIYKAEFGSTEGRAPLHTSSGGSDHRREITAAVAAIASTAKQPASSSTTAATEGVDGDEESDVDDGEFRSTMRDFTETLLLNKGKLKGGIKAMKKTINKMVRHRSMLLEPSVLLAAMHTFSCSAHALRRVTNPNIPRPKFRLAERLRIKGGRKPRNSVKRKAKSSTHSTHKKSRRTPMTEPSAHGQNVALVSQGGALDQSQAQVQTVRPLDGQMGRGGPSEQRPWSAAHHGPPQTLQMAQRPHGPPQTLQMAQRPHGPPQTLQMAQRPLQQTSPGVYVQAVPSSRGGWQDCRQQQFEN